MTYGNPMNNNQFTIALIQMRCSADRTANLAKAEAAIADAARQGAQIEARVSSGRASADDLKLLRAICKHMGDRGCSDRASALLAGQK